MSMDFRESAIKAITEDLDGNTIYAGTGSGDLAAFDMRTGLNISQNFDFHLFACCKYDLHITKCSFLESKMLYIGILSSSSSL